MSGAVCGDFERWSRGANTHVSGEREFSPLSSAHMLWSIDNCCCLLFLGQNQETTWVSSPKKENSVINYSPSCRSKPIRPSFIFRTHIKIFLMKFESFLTLHRQQGNYHGQGRRVSSPPLMRVPRRWYCMYGAANVEHAYASPCLQAEECTLMHWGALVNGGRLTRYSVDFCYPVRFCYLPLKQ